VAPCCAAVAATSPADEAGAHDEQVGAGLQSLAQAVGVVDGPQHEAAAAWPLDRQGPRADAAGDHQALEGGLRAVRQGHRPAGQVCGDGGRAQSPVDVRDRLLAPEGELIDVDALRQSLLGQRRPVVWQVGFVAHHGDGPRVPGPAQGLGGPQAAQPGTDDQGAGREPVDGDGLHRAHVGGGLHCLASVIGGLGDVLQLAVVVEGEDVLGLEAALPVVLALVHVDLDADHRLSLGQST
jgi:hypothetical protein